MEDSFNVRVLKAFGSLSSSSTEPPSSNLSSLWCLTDDEIERNEWNRDKDSPEPHPTSNDSFPLNKGFLSSSSDNYGFNLQWQPEKDLDDLDDDDDDHQSPASSSQLAKPKPDDYNEEEWEIKNSIGMDCTLDFEVEEDEYDKVAVGKSKEKPDDRVYMKEIHDFGIYIDSNGELPHTFKDVVRDPRANHVAAKLRLKEDAEAAKKMDSLRVSDGDSLDVADDRFKVSSDDFNPKSILKRRDDESASHSTNNQSDSKSQKRVRFDPDCKDGDDYDPEDSSMDTDGSLVYPLPPDYPSGIPDYMRNPTKYTKYTFDSSSDVDDQSNRQAFWDFLKMLNKSNAAEAQPDDASDNLPKFIPKRKSSDADMVTDQTESRRENQEGTKKESLLRKSLPISIAAGDVEDSETNDLAESKPETTGNRKNSGRKYRTKNSLEIMDESV